MDPAELANLVAHPGRYLESADPAARRLAISALSEADGHVSELRALLEQDPEPRVRASAAEALGTRGDRAVDGLLAATEDGEAVVVEAVATALGEIGDARAVPWLVEAARRHRDRLVREAAVAALGAIGDPAGLPVLLALVADAPPQVRRRSVAALTVFEGAEVRAAIEQALEDRNPMVREAAEMVVGRPLPPAGGEVGR